MEKFEELENEKTRPEYGAYVTATKKGSDKVLQGVFIADKNADTYLIMCSDGVPVECEPHVNVIDDERLDETTLEWAKQQRNKM